jgi:hypothetical protein
MWLFGGWKKWQRKKERNEERKDRDIIPIFSCLNKLLEA